MHLDENGLTKLWSKLRNYLSRKLDQKADKSNTYTKNDVNGLIISSTDGYLRGSIEEVIDSETGVTLRKFLFGNNSFYMARQEVTYYNNLAVYFPMNTGRNDAPIFILCTLSDCGSTSWKGGSYTYSIQRRSTDNTILVAIDSESLAGNLVVRYRCRSSGGIYNLFMCYT